MVEREFPYNRVLVTGGAGFIGSHLVDSLLECCDEVVVLDNLSSGERENLEFHLGRSRLTLVEGDVRDYETVAASARGVEAIFHLAVQCVRLSLSDPNLVHEVNATGSLNVAMAAHACSVKRLIYVSTSEVYGTAKSVPMTETHPLEPTTVYGASKLAGELYTMAVHRTHNLPVVIVRPFNSYGPRAHANGVYGEVIPRFMANGLLGQQSTIFGDGSQTRDFTYVADTVKGLLQAAANDELIGDSVNIALGSPVSILELSTLIAEETQTSELSPRVVEARPGDVAHHHASIEKARRVLRFEPEVSLPKGLRRYADWLRNRPEDWNTSPEQYAERNW